MNKTLRRLCAFAAAVMLALYCAVAAAAAGKTGSLTVLLSDGDGAAVPDILIRLYRVGEPDGTLTPEFSAADITPDSLLSQRDSPQNAVTLAKLASARQLTGTETATDQRGSAYFTGLTEGVYLVLCPPGQAMTFPVFLVRVPLTVNGSTTYDIVSRPKAEPPADPMPTPSPTPDGALPQTGADPLPLLLLPTTVMCNVLSAEEGMIVSLLTTVAYGWTIGLIFLGMTSIHHYGPGRNLAAMLMSGLGMLVITFLLLLFASLTQKLGMFIHNVIVELSYRL